MKIHSVEEDVYILAIESSCDETAAAVVKNGREVLSNVISSQIALHTLYGGVVPEIASRKHIEKVNQVVQAALDEAHMTPTDLVLWARFSWALRRQRLSLTPQRSRWCRFIISRDMYPQTLSSTRIWNRRLSARSCPADIRIL